ncbi:hypothetical protein LGQ02_20705 [Bacillus shivajii]|uniref:hypothetical protein n=1 Tax=Bacillus shivajii TaxID=1983719 RepID=UPI001CFB753D|nr:hypothetical protein [Bacillus shivajii]UCZ53164.1 hypothetical protein LGQ02_20705 [Bacillus shivajii]
MKIHIKITLITVLFIFPLLMACNSQQPETIGDEAWIISNKATDSIINFYENNEELDTEPLQDLDEYYSEHDQGLSADLTTDEAVLITLLSRLSSDILYLNEHGKIIFDTIEEDLQFIKKILGRT